MNKAAGPASPDMMLGAAARRLLPLPAWMAAPNTRRLLAVLGPGQGLFVGGCVRDALLGLVPADIDIATPLVPDQVMQSLRRTGIKALPTGIAHGTITAILPSGEAPVQFEITSLRCDIATDGRHAQVAFGTNWRVDAERRDFTINALYADGEGAVFDPVGGLADLAAQRVRFIGDAAQRVAEDYLRVLRFFRFHARFGGAVPDATALAACRAAAGRLQQLSGERVRDELLKILALPRADEALAAMAACGVLAALLPGHRYAAQRFAQLLALSDDAWLRLAALLPPGESAEGAAALERLRLSRAQQHRMAMLSQPPAFAWAALTDATQRAELFYQHGAEYCRDHAILLALDDATRIDQLTDIVQHAARWRRPVFPLRGADLLQHGLRPGPNISLILKQLEAWWCDGGFQASREACLNEMRLLVRIEAADQPGKDEPQQQEAGNGDSK